MPWDVRVLNILDFRVCQVSAYASVAQGSEYTWLTFHKVWTKPFGSKYVRAQNMIVNMFVKRLWIFEGYTGCWICLNKPEYALIITQYAWICLNNAEYDIWKNSAKYARILKKSDAVPSIRPLYCTNYWAVIETDVFKTLSNI